MPEQLIASLAIRDYELLMRLSRLQAYHENPIDLHEALSSLRDGFQTLSNLIRRGLVQVSLLHGRAVLSTTVLGKKIVAAMDDAENSGSSLVSELDKKIRSLGLRE